VISIEHGNLLHEETPQMMKDKNVWWCPQVIVYTDIPKGYTEDQANKHREAYAGIDDAFKMAKKIGYENIGFGTDIITDPAMIARMNYAPSGSRMSKSCARQPRRTANCWASRIGTAPARSV
jgi:imidazolonepropionase-like amidohydrolase